MAMFSMQLMGSCDMGNQMNGGGLRHGTCTISNKKTSISLKQQQGVMHCYAGISVMHLEKSVKSSPCIADPLRFSGKV